MTQILVFGDSISYGAWDLEGGWVQRLRKYLDKINLTTNSYYIVYNLGVSGDTSLNLLERFKFETEQRLDKNEETIFIFAIGANDSLFLKSKDDFLVEKEGFKKNLGKLIKSAKSLSKKIIFIGLTPVDESKVNPLPWDKDKSNNNKHVKKYDSIIKSICSQNKVHFIELYDEFTKQDYKSLLQDGDHPNSKGHELIFNIVNNYLNEKRLI